MTIQANFPAIKPSLMLDFANTKQLDSRITYTRASTGSLYDGVTTSKAEENLLTYSQAFGDGSWTKGGGSVTSDSTTAPDGTTTADTFTEDGSASAHNVYKDFTAPANVVYTTSVYAKYISRQWVALRVDTAGALFAWFDIQNGVLGTVQSGVSATITSVGSGWYRLTITFTPTTTSATKFQILSSSADNNSTFAFTGSSAFYLWGAQCEQRSAVSAYTATTTQAITNYIPKLQSAASGVARFDNNPTTGESLGLLIEESRTNLFTYSEQFDNAAWTKQSSTITANAIVSPDGSLDGEKLDETTANDTHRLEQNVTTVNGTVYTISVFAKAAERQWVYLFEDSATNACTFNLATGAVGTTQGSVTASISSVGNGWYRCSLTYTQSGTTGRMRIAVANGTSTISYTGVANNGIFIWGAQVEAGAFATSYIPTVASQVTRAADAASMTGTNFSSWYNNAEWTLYTETTFTNLVSSVVVSIDDNSFNNIARIGSYLNDLFTNVYSNSAFQFNQTPVSSLTKDVFYKIGFAAKPNSYAAIANTNTLITQNSGILFTGAPFQMTIGNFFNGDQFTGRIKKIAYYPVRVTNAQLAALTS